MSTVDDPTACGDPDHYGNPACQQYPEFELAWDTDDSVEPGEITIFTDEDGAKTTEWITVDIETAVALEDLQ
ncbi:MAG: hypothetical protein ABEH35_01390 [Haloarculaceae archaeon]